MTLTVTTNVLYDGPRNAVLTFSGTGGALDLETNVPKLIVANLSPVPQLVKVWRIEYDVQGILVQVLWDATTPVLLTTSHGWGEFDYDKIGGAPNPKAPGFTGNILFSTVKPIGGGDYMESIVNNVLSSEVARGNFLGDDLDQLRADTNALWSYSIKFRLKKVGVPFNTDAN